MSAISNRRGPEVLSYYPAVFHGADLIPLGNQGGFSGASLWRLEAGGQAFCFRAWPPRQSEPVRLDFLHGLMREARSCGLAFVPAVIATTGGRTYVEHASQLWDLTEWLPGRADFHDDPSIARLQAACIALARVHVAWEKFAVPRIDVCPALCRRLAAAAEWEELRRSGWRPRYKAVSADPVQPIAERAWHQLERRVAQVATGLRPRADRRWQLQPCLCDVWHDHLLFEGDRLTGLIDYGSAKIDHPAVDIARMFGSLVPDDAAAWQAGLRAYRSVRPFSDEEAELALALDESGTVIGAATWLRWLYEEFRPFEDRAVVARRLGVLTGRMEKWEDR
jgi:Ser/Thr protein kinase RdoA (MazF antagonist)